MKRCFFSLFCLFSFIFSFLFPQISITSALSGIELWFHTLLPSLFPAMVLSSLLISSGLLNPLFSFFKKFWNLFWGLTPSGGCAFLFGILCGFPMGAKTTADLYQSNKISKQEACYLLTFSAFPNPAFLTGYLSLFVLEEQVPNSLLFFIFYLSSFLTSLFFRRVYPLPKHHTFSFSQQKETSRPSFTEILDASIMNSLLSITKLGGYIILFSVFQGIFQFLFSSQSAFSFLLCGIMEFSSGLAHLKNTTLSFSLSFLLAMSITSFGGLCVLAQTSCVLSKTDLPLFPYLAGRLCCMLITTGLSFLFIIFF